MALLDHDLAELAQALEQAQQIGVDVLEVCLVGHLQDRHRRAAAGVVDEDVDLAELGENGIQSGLDLFQIIHIALDRQALDAEGANFFRDLIELFLASGKNRDVCALTGHGKCKTSSETDRCAGDNGNFTVKIKHNETS